MTQSKPTIIRFPVHLLLYACQVRRICHYVRNLLKTAGRSMLFVRLHDFSTSVLVTCKWSPMNTRLLDPHTHSLDGIKCRPGRFGEFILLQPRLKLRSSNLLAVLFIARLTQQYDLNLSSLQLIKLQVSTPWMFRLIKYESYKVRMK